MKGLPLRIWSVLTDKPKDKWQLQEEVATWDDKTKTARCPSEREIRDAINKLRAAGYPVVSNSDVRGYWKGSKEDVIRTINEYRARGKADIDIADAMEKGPDLGQLVMEMEV